MAAEPAGNPYVGPRPFEREDAPRFFGREREVRDVVSLVIAQRVVLLYSASGAGKSSLLNAGVLPTLEDEKGFEVLPVARVRADDPDPDRNVFVSGILASLESASAPRLPEALADRPRSAGTRLRALVIDQFEELFTAHPARWQEQPELFAQLRMSLEGDPSLRLVLAIREDFVAQLDPFPTMLPGGLRTRFRLERLDRASALAAVTRPLAGTGRSFAPGVAETLVGDLLRFRVETGRGRTDEVEGQYVEPVQLQVACRTLWADLPPNVTEITAEHLQAYADVNQVLGRFYEDAVSAAATGNRRREGRIREWVADALITPGGTRAAAYAAADDTEGLANDLVHILEEKRLVRAEWRAGARWYELTHDRLIEPVIGSNAAFSRRRARRRRRVIGVPLLLVLAAALAAVFFAAGQSSTESSGISDATREQHILAQRQAQLAGLATHIMQSSTTPLSDGAYSPDGRLIATAGEGGQIDLWRTRSWTRLRTLQAEGSIGSVFFSPDGSQVVGVVDDTSTAEAWDLRDGGRTTLPGVGRTLRVAFSPTARVVATASSDGIVRIYPVRSKRLLSRFATGRSLNLLVFSPDGKYILEGNTGSALLRLWDWRRRKRSSAFGHRHEVSGGAAFSPDGRLVATVSDNAGMGRVWDARSGRQLAFMPIGRLSFSSYIASPSFSPDGTRIATRSGDSIRVWYWPALRSLQLGSRAEIRRFQRGNRLPPSGTIDRTTRKAIVAALHPTVLVGQSGEISTAAFSPGGNVVLSTSSDGTAWTWGDFGASPNLRTRIVQAALAGVANRDRIGLSRGPGRLQGIAEKVRLPNVPTAADASSFVTWCYWEAGAPNPNGGSYDVRRPVSIATVLQHGRHIPRSAVKPGDLVVFGAAPGKHVALVVSAGADPLLVSHGAEIGPIRVRFSDEARFQRAAGHSTVTWIDALG